MKAAEKKDKDYHPEKKKDKSMKIPNKLYEFQLYDNFQEALDLQQELIALRDDFKKIPEDLKKKF